MLNKDSIKTLVASSLYSFHDEILKNEFATKKYVDDNMANVPLKKITSTEQTPIIISELSDGIYDFGNTSFVKMFSSDTEILKNVLGICILYSISDTKKILFVNFKSNIAIFNVEDRYALDIQNKAYTMLQFTKLVSIGGSSNTPVVLLDEITENGGKSFGLYQTTCTNLKLTANSKAVRLDSGSKILLVTSSTTKEITTYQINSFGAFSIKKIKYEYNKNTKEATLKSVDTVVFKSDFDNTIYDVKKNDTYIRAIYGNPFNVLNESIKNATYVNNDKTNDKNVTRYFNINKAIDNITDFDKCIIHLKFYRYGELKIYRAITGFNRQFNYFNALLSTDDCKILITLALDKQINENLEEIDAKDKCYCSIKYALTAEQEAIDIIDTGNIEIQIANNRILQLNNTKEFVPTEDYNPATKKYVDDISNNLVKKDTNKYVLITNDDTLIIKKDSITDIADATVTIDNLTGKFGTLVANDDGTYSYTLNTIMTDVETFTFKVNNVDQKLVIVPYKEMTYDDKNAGITYEGNWYEDTNDKYYKKSSHYTKGSDNSISKLSFIFTGTAVRFIGMTSKALGQNNIRSQIFVVNSDGSVGTTAAYTLIVDNNITSTDDILYNTSLVYNNIDDKLGYGKYKSVLTSGKGSSGYVDRIIVYNTIQKLNDSIQSLYNQKESAPTVLRTDIPNTKFEPKELYDPATKYYVDKTVAAGKTAMCTDEEIDNMLNEVLGGDYSGN